MPDQDNTNNTTSTTTGSTDASDALLGSADMPDAPNNQPADEPVNTEDKMKEIIGKISDVHNILIALSSDPSVDEIAAAIGLSMYLDRAGKRATSIYSGKTPNALEFLKPEETFETTADVLKDFVIALNKEKADHLRYKLDGDYVKIFITPYKSRINNEDLEFSYGDFNIEFVLALNVANGIDLDDALREHGRVMHDAAVANITTGNPGKFGDIEWSDKTASSVCEMASKMLYSIGGKDALTGEEATAFLTGIVSATDHFSNAKTTANALKIASELMKSGADRQLIADNISLDSENMFMRASSSISKKDGKEEDSDSLVIDHDSDSDSESNKDADDSKKTDDDKKTAEPAEKPSEEDKTENSELLKDLEAAAAGLAAGDVTTPEAANEPLRIDGAGNEVATSETSSTPEIPTTSDNIVATNSDATTTSDASATSDATTLATPNTSDIPTTSDASTASETTSDTDQVPSTAPSEPTNFTADTKSEMTITPSADFTAENPNEGTSKYGQMLEEALAEANASPEPTPFEPMPTEPTFQTPTIPTPEFQVPSIQTPAIQSPDTQVSDTQTFSTIQNPAMAVAPAAPTAPEINGVPEINYAPVSNDEILPPPPTPPVDFNGNIMPPQAPGNS